MNENLASKAQAGNQEAMAQLLYSNYEIVLKYLIKFTFSVSVAEELVQETMIKAIEKISMFNPDRAKFSTWLISIAQNIYIDSLRKKKREQKYVDEDINLEDLTENQYLYDNTISTVVEALSHVSEDIRLPIILKHYYGYSLEEIALKMSIPLGTVKSRIHNGLSAVRKELEAYE